MAQQTKGEQASPTKRAHLNFYKVEHKKSFVPIGFPLSSGSFVCELEWCSRLAWRLLLSSDDEATYLSEPFFGCVWKWLTFNFSSSPGSPFIIARSSRAKPSHPKAVTLREAAIKINWTSMELTTHWRWKSWLRCEKRGQRGRKSLERTFKVFTFRFAQFLFFFSSREKIFHSLDAIINFPFHDEIDSTHIRARNRPSCVTSFALNDEANLSFFLSFLASAKKKTVFSKNLCRCN